MMMTHCMHETPKLIRFWSRDTGALVRIALRDGQRARIERSWRHEEGSTSLEIVYRREGLRVYKEIMQDGTDCDGRLQQFSESFFDLHERESYPWDDLSDTIKSPMWHTERSRQRDFAAEAMGY